MHFSVKILLQFKLEKNLFIITIMIFLILKHTFYFFVCIILRYYNIQIILRSNI